MNESALRELLGEIGAGIEVPAEGPERVVDALTVVAARPKRSRRHSGFPAGLLVAAAVVVGSVIFVATLGHSSSSEKASSTGTPVLTPGDARKQKDDALAPAGDTRSVAHGTVGGSIAFGGATPGVVTAPAQSTAAPAAPGDTAKIVKTGTLDLQAAHGTLHATVNRVTAAATGLGGYVSNSQTSYGGTGPTAEITVRVPVAAFDTAVAHLDALPGITVLSDSEKGSDVTGQYVDLHAQLTAATATRDSLLVVLSHAQTIGDILAVTDRVNAAQTQVEQLQGRINVLGDQASFSSLAVSLSEKPVPAKKLVAHHGAETGLAKSWSDARHGFANVVEWLIARSGGALIVMLFALALLFGVRYLYPIVRRGLL
jgi:hypothetical protein